MLLAEFEQEKKWQERYILPLAIVMKAVYISNILLKISPTNLEKDIYKVVMHFADKLCNKQALYRTLSISLSQFINEDERRLHLF